MSPKESVKNIRVIDCIKGGVESVGVRGLAKLVGLSPAIITRYVQGKVGEPSQATLEKLANFFGVTVAYLRGEVTYSEASRREEVERVFEAIHRIVRRGNLSHEDMMDIDYVSTGFAALVQDAFQLEEVLQLEESNREFLIGKRILKEHKDLMKEFEVCLKNFEIEEPQKKS